jgi:hypothetical protein
MLGVFMMLVFEFTPAVEVARTDRALFYVSQSGFLAA